MSHTPGPWRYDEHDNFIWSDGLGVVATSRLLEMQPRSLDASVVERNANALLMAAAPDLLAALQGVLRVADRATDEFDAARAAIDKAMGKLPQRERNG